MSNTKKISPISNVPYYPFVQVDTFKDLELNNGKELVVLKTSVRKQGKDGIWYEFLCKQQFNVPTEGDIIGDFVFLINMFHNQAYTSLMLWDVDTDLEVMGRSLFEKCENQDSEPDRLRSIIPKPRIS
jgi:hypothetical protein